MVWIEGRGAGADTAGASSTVGAGGAMSAAAVAVALTVTTSTLSFTSFLNKPAGTGGNRRTAPSGDGCVPPPPTAAAMRSVIAVAAGDADALRPRAARAEARLDSRWAARGAATVGGRPCRPQNAAAAAVTSSPSVTVTDSTRPPPTSTVVSRTRGGKEERGAKPARDGDSTRGAGDAPTSDAGASDAPAADDVRRRAKWRGGQWGPAMVECARARACVFCWAVPGLRRRQSVEMVSMERGSTCLADEAEGEQEAGLGGRGGGGKMQWRARMRKEWMVVRPNFEEQQRGAPWGG